MEVGKCNAHNHLCVSFQSHSSRDASHIPFSSPTPWYPTTCDDQCSLTDCDKLEIPDDVTTCENRKCTSSWCEGGQVCPKDAPFQCVDGSGRFGCSMDALHWTLRVGTNVCTDCCDTTTCDK